MQKYLQILNKNPLFKGLTDNEIIDVLDHVENKIINKKASECIFYAGDTTSFMGIVLSGSVMVIQDDVWGHRNIMNKIMQGDIFGEIFASAPGSIMNVSVIANETSKIMMLNVNDILIMKQVNNRIIQNLIMLLAKKTLAFNDKITHISKRKTKDKLLSFLSAQALTSGKLEFDIPYDRQQLADYLCVERAAMSVELSNLQKEGYLVYDRNHFKLLKYTF